MPGERWGDESPWLQAVARGIARGSGQVTLLVNGGRVAHDEAVAACRLGHPRYCWLGVAGLLIDSRTTWSVMAASERRPA